MPHAYEHSAGLFGAAVTAIACWYAWKVTPAILEATVFSEFRLVGGVAAMFLVMTGAELIHDRIRRAQRARRKAQKK